MVTSFYNAKQTKKTRAAQQNEFGKTVKMWLENDTLDSSKHSTYQQSRSTRLDAFNCVAKPGDRMVDDVFLSFYILGNALVCPGV